MSDTSMEGEGLVRQLLAHEEVLPEGLRTDILARGAEVVGPLLAILQDDSLAYETAPGGGQGPIHAASLLAELRAPEAIGPLLDALGRTGLGDALHDAAHEALETMGAAVVPVALERLASARDASTRLEMRLVLVRSGTRDERIFSALLEQLREDRIEGAWALATYGDPRAIEPLKRELDACEPEPGSILANKAIIELILAIRKLGGQPDEAQWRKLEQAGLNVEAMLATVQRLHEQLDASAPARRELRPGRNDRCWCGSGVKYKKCHLALDREAHAPGT